MKVTGMETFLVPPRWLFLRVETDEGIVGWGEPTLESRTSTVAAAIAELSDVLIGSDPMPIEDHWQVVAKGGFYRGGPVLCSALAGIDQALWDIKGKALGVPIHELLGGPVRDRVRVYSWIHGQSNAELTDSARRAVESGFDAVKINLTDQMRAIEGAAAVRATVDRVAAVRDAVGPDIDVAIDAHGRLSTAMARRILPLLEPLVPLFVEEPTLPEFSPDLAQVSAATSTPIAVGERLYSRWEFRDVLRSGIAVAQPDLSHAGGISEVRRIAAMAEAHDVSLAPHCPLGPIALAASLQVDFAAPNFLIQEQGLQIQQRTNELLSYLMDPSIFQFTKGYVERPAAPGLGIDIDEAALRRAARDGHRWRNQTWRHIDGSFAEW